MSTPRTLAILTTLGVLTVALLWVFQGVEPISEEDRAHPGTDPYNQNCATCHGRNLRGAETGPPLVGRAFELAWEGRTVADLFQYNRTLMPPGGGGSLSDSVYLDISAYILKHNGMKLDSVGLAADMELLSGIEIRADTER